MKICYIWSEKFRNFNNLGLNLSSSTKFKFNSEKNHLTKKNISALPKDFFGKNITDVVGIIGKNGAGKSNAVDLVCKIIKGGRSSLQSDFFVIVEENGNLTAHYSFYSRKKPKADFDIDFEDYNGSINPLKVVFFSNVFDERRNDFDSEVSDISVNNLFNRPSHYKKDNATDFEKQIKLIDTKIFKSLNIEIPTKVQLTSKVWVNRTNTSMENFSRESYDTIRNFKSNFRDRLRDIKPENKFIHIFRFGFFFEIFNNFSRRSSYRRVDPRNLFKNINRFIKSLDSLRTTEEITEKLIIYLEREISKSTIEQISLFTDRGEKDEAKFEKVKTQLDFIKNIKSYVSNMNLEYNSEGSRNRGIEYFTFNYKPHSSKDFINEFIKLFAESSVFEINWLGISSGHKAYLNLFASLHNELKKARQGNLLLCIDEGDLYLHPKWQVEFFDKLLFVLPIIYSGSIQLILTSHSPFLLSDLPNQNITILDKQTEGYTLDGINLKINTFGGNLYDLYSEPFFLGERRTSDFAYEKIKELINSVESKNLSGQNRKDILKLTNILGDEIIKFQIKKLLKND